MAHADEDRARHPPAAPAQARARLPRLAHLRALGDSDRHPVLDHRPRQGQPRAPPSPPSRPPPPSPRRALPPSPPSRPSRRRATVARDRHAPPRSRARARAAHRAPPLCRSRRAPAVHRADAHRAIGSRARDVRRPAGRGLRAFTWLDALLRQSLFGPRRARGPFHDTLAADEVAAAADFFYNGTDIVLTRPGDDDTPEFPVQDYESALNRYCAALYWAVRAAAPPARAKIPAARPAARRGGEPAQIRSRRSATATSPRRTHRVHRLGRRHASARSSGRSSAATRARS